MENILKTGIILVLYMVLCRSAGQIFTSNELMSETISEMRKTDFYEELSSIMVKFVMHFDIKDTMTIETENGTKELRRNEDVERFDEFLIYSTLDLEQTRQKIHDNSFRYDLPVNAFRFIRNNTEALQIITNTLLKKFQQYQDEERTRNIFDLTKQTQESPFPTSDDYNGVTKALIELQEVYGLLATELADGKFLGDGSERLNAQECMDIGEFANMLGKPYLFISWLEVARNLVEEAKDKTVTKLQIYKTLSDAYDSVGCRCLRQAFTLRRQISDLQRQGQGHDLDDTADPYKADKCNKIMDENCVPASKKTNEVPDSTDIIFKQMCKAAIRKKPMASYKKVKSHSGSKCILDKTSTPFYIINPFKVEIVNMKPKIILVHDIISKNKKDLLIHHGIGNLQVEHRENMTMTLPNKVRAIAITLKSQRQSKLVTGIQRKIAAVSKMEEKCYSDFFLVNYGIGGYDKPSNHGDRIGSVSMTLFLNNIEVGGDIIFPHLGLSIKPLERSMLIVYGKYTKETGSDITKHGACPVVKGNRWTATQVMG